MTIKQPTPVSWLVGPSHWLVVFFLWQCFCLRMPEENKSQLNQVIPHICHGHKDGVRGEKICHVEKFQISVHETCGES